MGWSNNDLRLSNGLGIETWSIMGILQILEKRKIHRGEGEESAVECTVQWRYWNWWGRWRGCCLGKGGGGNRWGHEGAWETERMKEKEAGRFKSTDIDSAIKSEAYIKSVYKIQFFLSLSYRRRSRRRGKGTRTIMIIDCLITYTLKWMAFIHML